MAFVYSPRKSNPPSFISKPLARMDSPTYDRPSLTAAPFFQPSRRLCVVQSTAQPSSSSPFLPLTPSTEACLRHEGSIDPVYRACIPPTWREVDRGITIRYRSRNDCSISPYNHTSTNPQIEPTKPNPTDPTPPHPIPSPPIHLTLHPPTHHILPNTPPQPFHPLHPLPSPPLPIPTSAHLVSPPLRPQPTLQPAGPPTPYSYLCIELHRPRRGGRASTDGTAGRGRRWRWRGRGLGLGR